MSIEIKQLNFTYHPKSPFEKQALKEIDLTIHTGEFFGIIGHTGSGKSTLVQHLNALIRVQSGQLTIDDYQLHEKKTDFRALRRDVGMVFQYPEYQLFAETVEKDIAFGLKNFNPKKTKNNSEELSNEQIQAHVKEAMEWVGLSYETYRGQSPFDLSGGQKRRVAIAGVIVTRPKILILDEPTAGLDPVGKTEIMNIILHLKAECTPTMIMISHDMNEISTYADRIAVMHEGRIEFVLPPKQLFCHIERLQEMGLDVPTAVRIAHTLIERGFHMLPNPIHLAELADSIAAELLKEDSTNDA